MRMTRPLVTVARILLANPAGRHWGYDLHVRSGVRSGVLYPMLRRLLDAGWLTDGWEDPSVRAERRPVRRYYQLTPEGAAALDAILQRAKRDQTSSIAITAITSREEGYHE